MNRSKDLRRLFKESLKCGSKVVSSSSNNSGKEVSCHIFFYEWSNVNNVPKMFFTLGSFDMFLRDCGIYLYGYQRELIRNSSTVYCTCYDGTKELNMKESYTKLCESMRENERIKKEIKELASSSPRRTMPARINAPHMIFEEKYID